MMISMLVRTTGAACLVLLAACGGREAAEAPADSSSVGAVAVETMLLAPSAFTPEIEAVGTVVPRLGRATTVSAPTTARIARVLVVAGQAVAAGASLVELDRTEIDAAARSAEAAVLAADAAATRAARLVTAGVLPRRDAEAAAVDLARARGEAATARRIAELATMRAPFAGIVVRVSATPGTTVDPGTPLVELADANAVDLAFALAADDAARLRAGQSVTLHGAAPTDSLGTATITTIGAAVDSVTRAVEVRAAVGHSPRTLRFGETVTGTVRLGTVSSALVVPIAALVPDGEGFRVFVVDSAQVAHARAVVVGGRTALVALVTSGLAAGDRIVTTGAYGLDDGVTVTRPRGAATTP